MRCVGFGPHEGLCSNDAGTPWTPFWCPRCDELRRKSITESLEGILKDIKKEEGGRE